MKNTLKIKTCLTGFKPDDIVQVKAIEEEVINCKCM